MRKGKKPNIPEIRGGVEGWEREGGEQTGWKTLGGGGGERKGHSCEHNGHRWERNRVSEQRGLTSEQRGNPRGHRVREPRGRAGTERMRGARPGFTPPGAGRGAAGGARLLSIQRVDITVPIEYSEM